MIYNKRVKLFIIFWEKVEASLQFKILFMILVGVWGGAIALFFSLLLLFNYELKWTWIMVVAGFVLGMILSPIEYRRFARKYRYFIEQMNRMNSKNSEK